MPVYPGSQEQEREDATKAENETETGWTTRAVYRLPAGVSGEQVLAFYDEQLAQWNPDEDCCAGLPSRVYRREQRLVSVNVLNAAPAGDRSSYEITVDAQATATH